MSQMLESTFIEILNMSLTASLVIIAVLFVRYVFHKVPRIYTYLLWGIVLFRLICPFSFEMPNSFLGYFQQEASINGRMEYIPEDIGYQMEPKVHLPVKAVNQYVNNTLPGGDFTTSVNPLQIWLYFLSRLWIVGMIAMLSYSTVALHRLRKQLKHAIWEKDNIYRFPGNHSPFIYGLFGTSIYLPEDLDGAELDYVLLHERIHIKRGDPFYRMLAYIALCIHWFNPLVWLAFSYSGKDMEISCDEEVIKQLGNEVKQPYSASLLNLACGDKIVKGIPVAFGESDTGSRIKHILRFRRPTKGAIILMGIVCIDLAVSFMANPISERNINHESIVGQLNPIEPKDGSYEIEIQSISEEKFIDSYQVDSSSENKSALYFSDDCEFFVNTAMSNQSFEKVDFHKFTSYFQKKDGEIYIPATVIFEGGMIKEAKLYSIYTERGVTYQPYTTENWSWNVMDKFLDQIKGEERTKTSVYSTLRKEVHAELSDREGEELIEVYTGNFLVTYPCGHVEFKTSDGSATIHSEFAFLEENGWNNVYLGEADGENYILQMYIRDYGESGSYSYQVFRLDRAGDKIKKPIIGQRVLPDEVLQIAGSRFEWGEAYIYDDTLFREWVAELEYYLEHSYLLLSSQNGELRTEQICELDKYNYDTLKRK